MQTNKNLNQNETWRPKYMGIAQIRAEKLEEMNKKLVNLSERLKKITKELDQCADSRKAEESFIHLKCRTVDPTNEKIYSDNIKRPYIPEEYVSWSAKCGYIYTPKEFTSAKILSGPSYADPVDVKKIDWNDISRNSHTGEYYFSKNGYPLNPFGRTGITGRGNLGKWGPNHAADPIVTRWKRSRDGEILVENGKNVLEFVAIQRKDTKEWAIPGGMCDPGEKVSQTLKREFMEEALNSLGVGNDQKQADAEALSNLFDNMGVEIYKGYVDDPRNTDNAWMETIAYNFHDDTGLFDRIKLEAGDDAGKVAWKEISSSLKLYASHEQFIKKTAELHNAFW